TGPVVSVYQSDSGTRIRHQEDSALTNGINSVLFSGDSSQIALFGRRPFAGFWPLEQQAFSLVEFAPIKEAVGTVAISPDSERIAYTHVRAEGNLWHAVVQVANLEDGTDVQTFPIFSQVHSGDVPRLIYGSSFGEPSHIYLSCSDGQVRKLNLETGVVSTLATLSGAVGAGISVTPDKNLVAVLAGGKVHVLRTSDGSSVQVIAPENTIESFSFSGNSAIAVGGGVLRVLEVPTGSELQRSIVIGTQVMSATQDGRFIATADRLRTYVFRRSDQGLVFTDGAYRTPGALAFLGGDKFLASFGRDATLRITKSSNGSQVLMYDQETGLEERPPHDTRPRGMTSGVVSPDGRYMAYGRVDGALVVARSPFSEFDLRVTRSTPSRVARLSQVFLNLEGGGFVEGAQVFLKQESQQLQASQVTVVDVTRLRAKFDLSAAALGAYEIVVRTPEAKEARLPNGLEVIAGAGEGQIAAVIEGPRLVRPDRDYVTEIEYTNTGSGSMPAPLLFISSGMKMRLSRQDGYSERPLVAMAIGESNQAGMLQPGATFRIPLYFRSVSGQAEITVSPIDSINASHYLNGWGQVRAQVYPFSLQNPPPQYEQIWVKFIEQFGNDSATHMQALRESAAYLALYGNRTPDVRKLMVNAMSAATGDLTPVSSLGDMTDLADVTRAGVISLGRTMPTGLGKYRTGPFGRGWWHTLEVHLEEEGNDIHIQSPGMRSRHFAKQPDGNYKGEPADHGKLEKPTTGGYRITELDGSVSIFDSTGHLMKLVDSNDNEVDLMYDGSGRLSEISADGRTLEITWTAFPNNQFRITKLTNSALQETSYVYDASGEFLLRVILPGGRHFRYDYYRGSGQSAGSLQKITSPDLSEQIFALDSLGRLSQISGTGGATPVQFALPGQGRVDTFDAASQRYTSQLGPEGQLMRSTNPVGDSVSMQYDDAQNLTELTSGRANRWSARYDAKGNPIWSKDPIGGELILSYTTDYNRLDKLKDRRGNTLDFDYDANGNTTRIRYPAAGSIPATEEVFTYYADGN
ncbi:MAG TPA: hypothetical protein VEX38_00545, partial [Fimbriimonadaceae bacterium]|nr:hypothetical protein [Fimbriimonadaceae bacterium]